MRFKFSETYGKLSIFGVLLNLNFCKYQNTKKNFAE